jgi:hypothetical protein
MNWKMSNLSAEHSKKWGKLRPACLRWTPAFGRGPPESCILSCILVSGETETAPISRRRR